MNFLFDLDGTLLPMEQDKFVQAYFSALCKKVGRYGYTPDGLTKAIWDGVQEMTKNDGSRTNEEVFWAAFTHIFGEGVLKDKPLFDEFYRNEFNNAQSSCGFSPMAKTVIDFLKSKNATVVLATNPIFPHMATEARVRWAGLDKSDFTYISTYENSSSCKPDLRYYREICGKLGFDPADCCMIGNDVDEDMVAEKLGMKVFLLTDCLINRKGEDIGRYPHGGFDELLAFLKENVS